jgi:protein SCO1
MRLSQLRHCFMLVLALFAIAGAAAAPASAQQRWGRDYFPNVVLQDQNGRELRFYDDVIRGKTVSINFIYTACTDICPLDTAQLRQVQQILGDRVGRDIQMYTISLNPERDTPAELRRFMRQYDVGPGWTFLTGSAADVQLLQSRLGLRPVDERSLREHDTSIIMGNERTGQWIKRSAYENPQLLAEILGRRLQNYAAAAPSTRQSYATAGEIMDRSQGFQLFRTRCQSCHTIGQGDRLGPDLAGVSQARSHTWLSRWIREPDRMIAERDPTALALMARYRNLPMPNLGLNDNEVQEILNYMRAQDARRSGAQPSAGD